MSKVRFLMIGGFLGAGKTTAIARLAKYYHDHGSKVGLVTNDQAYGLVDTHALRSQGFDVGEVPGACFCCKFDDLVNVAQTLKHNHAPDIIITEPVGSCTDLIATVIEPLHQLHDGEYEISPLIVLLKPEHGLKILRGQPGSGFSPKAAYIFLKQIEEADVVAVNKIDKLTSDECNELVDRVKQRFPGKSVIAASGKTGEGFDQLIEFLSAPGQRHETFMDVDYDKYAEGEAELGWLNATFELKSAAANNDFPLDDLAMELLEHVNRMLAEAAAEAAHLKVLCQRGNRIALANLVGTGVDVELSAGSQARSNTAELIVNARASTSPEALETIVQNAVRSISETYDLDAEQTSLQRFRPGRPTPTHRMTS